MGFKGHAITISIILTSVSASYTDNTRIQALSEPRQIEIPTGYPKDPSAHTLWPRGIKGQIKRVSGQPQKIRQTPVVKIPPDEPSSYYIEQQANKNALELAHTARMDDAKKAIAKAYSSAADINSRGQREPPHSAEAYKKLNDTKVTLRRASKNTLRKIDIAADAVHGGSSMRDTSMNQKLDQAQSASERIYQLTDEFAEAHRTAKVVAEREGRPSDLPGHIKHEVKSEARYNAIVNYNDAVQMERSVRFNRETLDRLRNTHPRNQVEIACVLDCAVKATREMNAAKQHYAMTHRHYVDARRTFPDDSSSEDEERKFL